MPRRKTAVLAVVAMASLVALGGVAVPRDTLAAGSLFNNSLNYGSPASPKSMVPSDLDVQIHRRDPSDAMEAMDAQHGVDCGAPPATHPITTLAQGVFSCKNHLMTAIGDSGYGEIALTPNYMADWSSGTTTITFNVSTLQDNPSDWIEVWLVPFAENQTLPFEIQTIDFQGPPKDAIVFSLNQSELIGTKSGDVTVFQNYVQGNALPKLACTYTGSPECINPTGTPSVVPASAVTRTQYEIDISNGHVKFGLPGVVNWTDAGFSFPYTQGIVQLVHHSYNPLKHSPGTGIDTFHWSNLTISNAVPFTIINGAERSINEGTAAGIHFPAPAPTGSYLRFSALGTITISLDGGTTYIPAVLQEPISHSEHFTSYMTPIPAGTQSVLVRGVDNVYAQPWWVRDPAIWSLTPTAPLPGGALPGVPSGVTATGGDGSATVNWTPIPASVTSYVVTAHDGCTVQGSITISGSSTSAVFPGLSNGVAYTFTVAAVNGDGVGVQSAFSNVVVPGGSTAPSWLSACSSLQYSLTGSDGTTWQDMDKSNLALSFTPSVNSWAIITGNTDLWTANAGFNQDLGLEVNGSIAAWKESGGFAGTFSPNAATVQAVIPVSAATAYVAKLKWKSSRPDPGSIFAGAGPISGAYSPTRITVQLVPVSAGRVFTTTGTGQYVLGGSNGSTWADIDPALSLPVTPPSGTWAAYVFANADLWTSSAGYNQDLGVSISGGAYPSVSGQPEAWKESGGFAGTFSPNAAFVQTTAALNGNTSYLFKLKWKTNRPDPGAIFAGAGPLGGQYSPTKLSVLLVPQSGPAASSPVQYSQAGSDGVSWPAIDSSRLKWSLSPGVDANYMISVGSDLWTSVAGYNQDIGIMVGGGAYGSGTLVAWKESGGFAGTFSPNAAFVSTDLHLQAGNTYNVWVVWKANRGGGAGAIWAGAGPVNSLFSPTSLTALQLS